MQPRNRITLTLLTVIGLGLMLVIPPFGDASSHREAPLISNDPLADNTDVYAFRSPDDPGTITILANYIPLELPEGGPNYTTFGEDIRYEIHIKNQTSVGPLGSAKDDITYRFVFRQENEDPTTFFNIRLGLQNIKTTYRLQKSTDGGHTFTTIVDGGIVPPNNIGPRSIEDGTVGLGTTYDQLVQSAVMTASTGETVFAGPRDDAFFVDLGGVFDVGGTRSQFGTDPGDPNNARDAVAGFNTHTIALKIPIEMLQKDGKTAEEAVDILDPDFVIGVWASASRPSITVRPPNGEKLRHSGPFVQVSRLGMPLTNEVIIPIGDKDYWNSVTPYSVDEQEFVKYFANPELALYMDDSQFGGAVPSLSALRVQSMSYPALGDLDGDGAPGLDFRNFQDGAFELVEAGVDLTGTAFDVPISPGLAGAGQPRLADIFPIFNFGVPNLAPYQLATGKTGGPLSAGKPFFNNFLPITDDGGTLYGGDMLRLNMATPPTDRATTEFETNAFQGLIRAAVLGLTDPEFTDDTSLEFIPHMDGFPNGRRPEDDVTLIELQAVGGLVLAAVGLPFDDAVAGDYSDLLSEQLLAELGYVAGPTANDVPLLTEFPYLAEPHRGYDYVKQLTASAPPASAPVSRSAVGGGLGLSAPDAVLDQNYPNPFNPVTTIRYHLREGGTAAVRVYDVQGRLVATLAEGAHTAGTYAVTWDASRVASGLYFYRVEANGRTLAMKKAILMK
ncbi:T9SS type A sorting domain-containing protein [Rhodocaloribacter sp.]